MRTPLSAWLVTLLLLVLCCPPVSAQLDTLPNPAPCGMVWPLTDNSCPENGFFFQPDLFPINVTNAPAGLLGMDVFLREVRLIVRHTWLSDLDLVLISPGGIAVDLSLDNGGSNENYGDPDDPTCAGYAAFAVGSCTSVKTGEAPFLDEPYAPEESFFHFNDGITPANGIWTLQICDDVALDTGSLRFVELIFEPLSCLPVEEVTVSEVDSTTVVLDWDESGSCATTVVEFGLPGFTPGTDSLPGEGQTAFFDQCPPFPLSGLAENTTYEIYVRKYCPASGAFSANACPVTLETGCLPPASTIVTTFDTLDQCPVLNCGAACTFGGVWQNDPVADDLDWFVNQGMTPTSDTGPSADVGGSGKYVYLETTGSSCNNGREAYLRSTCIQLEKQGTDSCHLSFNYHLFGINVGSLRLEVTEDGGVNWTSLWSRAGNQGNQWHKTYLSLAGYADGQVLQFRFVAVGGNGSRGDIALDNIVFHGSVDLGEPTQVYYLDSDGDGYGRQDFSILSCALEAPPGYADNPDDCNDSDNSINPGQPEILCDRIDNNCNGLDTDDGLLPAPAAEGDTICSGQTATICATAGYGGNLFWYASPDSTDFVGFGNCLSFTFTNDTPGPDTYRYYVEEVDVFCRSVERAEVVVVVYPNPDLSAAGQPSICPGQSFNLAGLDIADANFTGGVLTFHTATPPTSLNELTSPVVSPTTPTTFFYQMTSPQGCTGENSVLVGIKPGPGLVFDPADSLSLCRDNSTTVTVTADGGTPPYSYFWSNGNEGSTLEVEAAFAAGTIDLYSLTVTDEEGCFTLDTLRVTSTSSIDSIRRFVTPVSTCMGSNGNITIIPLNGQPPFDFSWSGSSGQSGSGSGVQDTILIDGLAQGVYRVTITDSSTEQCAFVTRQVVVNGPDVIVEGVDITPVSCAAAADGAICVAVSSLTGADPSFLWSDGQTGPCATGLAGGTYAVTIEGGMCLSVIDSLLVPEPDSLKVKATKTPPSCADATDGRIELSIFGGTAAYEVDWNVPQSGPVIDNLPTGLYTATVTDANGCLRTDTFDLAGPPPLSIQLDSLRQPTCFGFTDGFALLSGQGGTPPYQYEWSTGATAAALFQAGAGSYSVTVTDFNGCAADLALVIGQPAQIDLELLDFTHPTCVGERTGDIAVAAGGGVPPYTYEWNTGAGGSLLTDLAVGVYSVSVTDSRQCPGDSLAVELTAESFLDLTTIITPPACEGPHTGSIAIQPNGVAPFSYVWSTGETTATASFLSADSTYAVTITDGRECVYDTSFQLLAPQVFAATYFVRDPSCTGTADGLIDVNLTAVGTMPVAYHWSDGATDLDRFGLPAGSLQLTIIDADSCTFLSPVFQLTDPPLLEVSLDALGDIGCAGESDGFIEITPTGGTPPYNINWLGIVDDTEDQYNLAAGAYRLLLQDAEGCPLDTTFVVAEPAPLQVIVEVETSATCDPDVFNRLVPAVTGGVPPYAFAWSTGSADSLLQDLPPGDYSLTVTDANQCEQTVASIKVREQIPPIQLDTFFTTQITCNGAADGTMTAVISGGQPPYLFFFSTTDTFLTSQQTITLTGLSQGSNYSVTVTDLNSLCSVQSPVRSIANPPLLIFRRDSVRQIGCEEGAIFTTTFGGTPPYSYAWFDGSGAEVGSGMNLLTSTPGVYYGVVTDGRGCADTTAVTTLEATGAVISTGDTLITPVACLDGLTGAIDLTVNGGLPPLTFLWSNGATVEDPAGLAAGLYSVTVTDALDCVAVLGPFQITEPATAITIQSFLDDLSCFGSADGTVEVTVSGGVGPYTYEWRQGNVLLETGSPRIDDLEAGSYELRIEDSLGCVRLFGFNLSQPDSLAVILSAETESVSAQVSGGVPPYEYAWNTGSDADTTLQVGAGLYVVTVTDANDCIVVDSLLLTGSRDLKEGESVRLFPNPGRDRLTVVVEWAEAGETSVVFYDLLGRPVKVISLGVFRAAATELEVGDLTAGVYWVGIRKGGKIRTIRRWVKLGNW